MAPQYSGHWGETGFSSISALELPMLTLPLDLCLNPFPDGPSTPSPFPWQVLVIFEDLTLIPNIFVLELPKWC